MSTERKESVGHARMQTIGMQRDKLYFFRGLSTPHVKGEKEREKPILPIPSPFAVVAFPVAMPKRKTEGEKREKERKRDWRTKSRFR